MGDDHQEEDRLVPDDPSEESAEVTGPGPVDVEQADERAHEDEQIGHTEVGARAPDPLDQEAAGQHDDGHEDRISHEDAEGEDQDGYRQTGERVERHRHPRGGSQRGHNEPGHCRAGQTVPPVRFGTPAGAFGSGERAHRGVFGSVMGPRSASGAARGMSRES